MEAQPHSTHSTSHKALFWGAGISVGLVLSPYILPSLGVGTPEMTKDIISLCGSGNFFGTGLSGLINRGLSHVPAIGEHLAAGGWTSALTSGLIGIGGTLLGNYISSHYDRPGHIQWGKVIKYAAIATSVLVALPSLLSGISMGISFLAMATGNTAVSSSVIGAMKATFGFMGAGGLQSMGAGLTGLLPHLVSCGAAALPAIGSLFVGGSQKPAATTETTTKSWTQRIEMPPVAMPQHIR